MWQNDARCRQAMRGLKPLCRKGYPPIRLAPNALPNRGDLRSQRRGHGFKSRHLHGSSLASITFHDRSSPPCIAAPVSASGLLGELTWEAEALGRLVGGARGSNPVTSTFHSPADFGGSAAEQTLVGSRFVSQPAGEAQLVAVGVAQVEVALTPAGIARWCVGCQPRGHRTPVEGVDIGDVQNDSAPSVDRR